MATTYVISPADDGGRMRAVSYQTREAATAVATKSDYVVENTSDVLWTGYTLVDVYCALTGKYIKKFESREVGVRRLMEALPGVAVQPPEDSIMDEETKKAKAAERAAAKEAKKQEAAAAKEAKKQEAEASKQAAKEAKAAAREAKKQEAEASKQAAKEAKAAAREAKKQEAAAHKASNGSGNRQRFADEAQITMLVSENPKKHGAASERFKLYRDGMSVKEALDAGILRADLSWDTRKGFISIAA